MKEIKLFEVKIESWAFPLDIRAYDEEDAEGLTRLLFKVPTNKKVSVTPILPEPQKPTEVIPLNRKGRKPLLVSLKTICDTLKDTKDIRATAVKLGCSRAYIYRDVGKTMIKELLRG